MPANETAMPATRIASAFLVVLAFAFGAASTVHADEGAPDPTFGGTGKRRIAFDLGASEATKRDYPTGLAVTSTGRIYMAGAVSDELGIVTLGVTRRLPNGGLDINFGFVTGTPGQAYLPLGIDQSVGGIAAMADQRLLVCGSFSGFGFVGRFRADGTRDDMPGAGAGDLALFQPNGRGVRFVDVVALPDNRFLAAGTIVAKVGELQRDFVVARFLESGALDTSFGKGGFATAAFDLDASRQDATVAMAVAPNGTIVLAGVVSAVTNDVGVAAFTANGQPDPGFLGAIGLPGRTAFEFAGGANDRVADVAVDSLGRIVLVATTDPMGTDEIGVARLLPNGLPDTSFGPQGRRSISFGFLPLRAGAVVVDPQNRIYPVGTLELTTPSQGPTQVFAQRLLENGLVDQDFNSIVYGFETAATGREDVAVSAALQGDRLVIASAAQVSGENYDFGLARFTSNAILADGFENP